LTSLDDLIAAQGRKVDAIKDHKRGLMQHLFPRVSQDETRPRARFPEFRKTPPWTMRKIGDMLEERERPIEMDDDAEYALVTVRRRYGGVVPREVLKGREIKVKSQFIVKANDFLVSNRQIVHDACGLVPAHLDGSIVSNEYSVLCPRPDCDIEFFNYFSQQPGVSTSFLQSSVGIVIEKMLFKLDLWLKHEFLFPSLEEQREIAGCLNSVSTRIETESAKLDALRNHKKGLMQQLFPSSLEDIR
jgi:type I restriction enzyme S subunit